MDERYFVYWDDTDFCYRLQKAGFVLMCDSSITMTHKVSSLTGGVTSDFFIRFHHRNQIYYVRKHFGPVVLVYTLLMSIVKAALRFLVGRDTLRQLGLRSLVCTPPSLEQLFLQHYGDLLPVPADVR